MKIPIANIKIAARIRKEVNRVEELAANIREHGLITPIAVMPIDGGEYQLLAGLRRIRAMELNGETEIESTIFPASDAEAALKIEYFENEQREPFTLAEKLEYAAVIAEIEKAKACERMLSGKNTQDTDPCAHVREGLRNRTDSVVSDKIGMKETSYRYAKYIAEKSPETIERIDNGEIAIRAAYHDIRAKEKAENESATAIEARTESDDLPEKTALEQKTPDEKSSEVSGHVSQAPVSTPETAAPTPKDPMPHAQTSQAPAPSKRKPGMKNDPLFLKLEAEAEEAMRRGQEFNALSPEGKIEELRRQLKEERARAATAESDLAREKELRKNFEYHYNGTLDMLRNQLAAAHARIKELEDMYEPN